MSGNFFLKNISWKKKVQLVEAVGKRV
jgi:hypothetical protein